MCMCGQVCMRKCACMHAHVRVSACAGLCVGINVYVLVCTCICIHIRILYKYATEYMLIWINTLYWWPSTPMYRGISSFLSDLTRFANHIETENIFLKVHLRIWMCLRFDWSVRLAKICRVWLWNIRYWFWVVAWRPTGDIPSPKPGPKPARHICGARLRWVEFTRTVWNGLPEVCAMYSFVNWHL